MRGRLRIVTEQLHISTDESDRCEYMRLIPNTSAAGATIATRRGVLIPGSSDHHVIQRAVVRAQHLHVLCGCECP
jgi:hypothetical protein